MCFEADIRVDFGVAMLECERICPRSTDLWFRSAVKK